MRQRDAGRRARPRPLRVPSLEKVAALEALIEHIAAGRAAGTRSPSRQELAATALLRLPLALQPGVPEPAPDLPRKTQLPEHVRSWRR